MHDFILTAFIIIALVYMLTAVLDTVMLLIGATALAVVYAAQRVKHKLR